MRLARLVLACVAAVSAAWAETVRIDLNGATTPISPEPRPGFFYNNTTSQANTIFDTCGITCNLMRCGDISYYLRTSSSYQGVMSRVRSMRSLYQHRAAMTDRLIEPRAAHQGLRGGYGHGLRGRHLRNDER